MNVFIDTSALYAVLDADDERNREAERIWTKLIEIVWVDEVIHRAAQHALLVSNRRSLSLVDCVSFEILRRYGG